ncbi:Alpha/Beta hydrolase protein [Lasiosphaeris hirsuta]|uniref:Alpha/Beta hydrolase protein n=1 Tax=Lasiosphaeris hirsuta TaxID=260670 RepID=A0AA40DYG1_9PEZI|nr:Alpha/Beta hydrolase protein [Lasiosphaeris hirsuta]
MSSLPPPAPPGFTDHAIPSTPLSIRVWPAPTSPSPLPILFLTHGGGAIGGNHFAPPPWIVPAFGGRYHLVSHSYRLAPQARLDTQLEDCLTAVAWTRANLGGLLGEGRVDGERYVLCGGSAGGLLVALMGLRLEVAPRAVVNVYGLVDWVSVQALDREGEAGWEGEFGREELEAYLLNREVGETLTEALFWDEKDVVGHVELSERWGADVRYTKRLRLQAELHVYRSLHPQGVDRLIKTAMHPETFADEAALEEFILSMSPVHVLRKRLEGGRVDYPPMAFLHGTGDVAVPVQQSYDMAAILKEMGVPVVEAYEEGEPHVFDNKYTGPDVPGWGTYIQPIVDFVDHHVGQ